jgi:dTDP-4-dehydrorhamnose reductase
LDLIDRDARGYYHVTNSGQTSWFDFARAIFEDFGLQPDLQPITSADWKAMKPQSATRPAYSVLDLSKFEQTVGRSMRRWREALREFKRLATAPNKS